MKNKSSSRRLSLENLEGRTLLAGNITASVVNGSLIITGDDLANSLKIEQTGTNAFRVAAFSLDGAPTSINGVANGSAVFTGVINDINISANGGADEIHQGDYIWKIPRNLVIDGGAGRDISWFSAWVGYSGRGGYVSIRNSETVVASSSYIPKNFVASGVSGFSGGGNLGVQGDVVITGTPGADWYELGSIKGSNLKVNTLAGSDFVSLTERPQIAGDVDIQTGDGDDQVRIGSLSADNLSVNLGGGADQLLAWGQSTIRHEARVFGGEGADKVSLVGFNAHDAFFVWLYTENDRLEIKNTTSPRAVLGGGPGTDRLVLATGNTIGSIEQTGFE